VNPPETITSTIEPMETVESPGFVASDAALSDATWRALPAPPVRSSRWAGLRDPLLLAGVGIAGFTYLALNDPNRSSSVYPQCPLKYFTGIDCPGCGMTRAMYSLMHGDLISAMSHNLLFVLALPFLAWALVRWAGAKIGYEVPPLVKPRPWMGWAFAALVVVFGVARNLPVPGLSWLGSA